MITVLTFTDWVRIVLISGVVLLIAWIWFVDWIKTIVSRWKKI